MVGTLWRLLGILRRPRRPDLSPPRERAPGALRSVLHANLRAMWPRPEFVAGSRVVVLNGWAFHIGLMLVVLGYAPHIAFVERLTGLSWPALPDPAMYLAAALTIVTLLVALVMRLTDPVRRSLSGADDWLSWTLTFLPFVTGMAVVAEPSAAILARDHVVYGGPLALHLLSVELLLLWFPFGKLMHAVLFPFSRGATGLRLGHRGSPVVTTAASPAADRQGALGGDARLQAATTAWLREFGVTASLHLESCVHCGQCAPACHFYVTTGDAKYTPVRKLELLRRAYRREAGPLAPLVRALGVVRAPSIDELEQWQELLYDACTMCGRCTTACPMGIDIAELVQVARHGMFKAGLVPDRLALMDRAARQWGSTATPGEDLPDILAEVSAEHGVVIPCDLPQADVLVTAAPAELGEHTAALAAAAKVLNRAGLRWTMHREGFDASNIGFNNGDLELQERLTRSIVDTAVRIGAHTVLLPECGHAYGAARWEAARWYGRALPVRIVHMTEFLDELLAAGRIRVAPVGDSATFHDPCQIVRRGGLEAAARRVLAALGFELRELQDHGIGAYCCGGGGGVVSIARAAPLRQRVFALKQQQVEATGARRFVTSCGQCRITLEQGARHAGWDRTVESLLELVADRLVGRDEPKGPPGAAST